MSCPLNALFGCFLILCVYDIGSLIWSFVAGNVTLNVWYDWRVFKRVLYCYMYMYTPGISQFPTNKSFDSRVIVHPCMHLVLLFYTFHAEWNLKAALKINIRVRLVVSWSILRYSRERKSILCLCTSSKFQHIMHRVKAT